MLEWDHLFSMFIRIGLCVDLKILFFFRPMRLLDLVGLNYSFSLIVLSEVTWNVSVTWWNLLSKHGDFSFFPLRYSNFWPFFFAP
jgi:hypothetical protein